MSLHQLDYSKYSILIVDYLEECGFNIRIARSGESALQRVAYDQPDIILLDVLMPGMDGFETCRRLKADAKTQEIPVIFMTALADPADKVKGFEVGAVDYVSKPLHQEEVLARITTHLSLRDLTRDLQEQNEQIITRSQVEKARLFLAVSEQRTQLRALTGKLTEVQEIERKQLARELHDEMGQALTAISMNLSIIRKDLPDTCLDICGERLDEASLLVDETLEQVRELSLNLRPPMLDDLGLVPTLRWYIQRYSKRTGMAVDFDTTHFECNANVDGSGLDDRLHPDLETAFYRVLQEALTNVARHAGATTIRLSLRRTDSGVSAYVEDDGCGFDVATVMDQNLPGIGAGLLGMRERMVLLGGRLTLQSEPGTGTQLHFSVPQEALA